MLTAGSLNELFQTEKFSDTAFTNSDAGANGASDAAGNNMARRTVHSWQLCSDAQSPVELRCRESAAAGPVAALAAGVLVTAGNVRWPGITVMSTPLSYAAPTAIIFYTLPEFI